LFWLSLLIVASSGCTKARARAAAFLQPTPTPSAIPTSVPVTPPTAGSGSALRAGAGGGFASGNGTILRANVSTGAHPALPTGGGTTLVPGIASRFVAR
jgi:hypothetical protein